MGDFNKAVSENRIGRFSLPIKFMWERADIVGQFLSQVLIIRAEARAYRNEIIYEGFSRQFEKVDPGERPKRVGVRQVMKRLFNSTELWRLEFAEEDEKVVM